MKAPGDMSFTVLSHAGLWVQCNGRSVLMDPWLIGSCYWRSWWNFPAPDAELVQRLRPDFIYITHLHWDHFHGPSLRLFDRATPILVPRAPTARMVDDLRRLGFRDLREIPHGEGVELAPGFWLYSYQFGVTLDSAAVLTDGRTTLFNANDAKLYGLPLRQITRRFPAPDFVFRSHSSASAIPYCIEGYRQRFPELRTQDDYALEFARFALHVRARYAVPFASNHCFLHRDTIGFNGSSTPPERVSECLNAEASARGVATRGVLMPPGSRWSARTGFHLSPFDYAQGEAYIGELARCNRAKLEKQYALEERAVADFKSFSRYFERLTRATPRWLARRPGLRVLFETRDREGEKRWLVDFRTRAVTTAPEADGAPIVIRTPALVLNDCARKRMFSVWPASKRLSIRLGSDENLEDLQVFFALLDLFETDALPLWNNLRLRPLGARLRRWREAVEFARLMLRVKLLRQPLVPAELYPLPPAGGYPAGPALARLP